MFQEYRNYRRTRYMDRTLRPQGLSGLGL